MAHSEMLWFSIGAGTASLLIGTGYCLATMKTQSEVADDFIGFRADIPRRSGVRSPDRSAGGIRIATSKKKRSSEFVM